MGADCVRLTLTQSIKFFLFNAYRVPVLNDDAACRALCVYLKPLNWTLPSGQNGKFYVRSILTTIRKTVGKKKSFFTNSSLSMEGLSVLPAMLPAENQAHQRR